MSFDMVGRPPIDNLFPYTTLFRSLATQPIASAIQPELETIATEAAVAAIGGGTAGRDAIRGILQDPNSQVHKETTLHGKITALKYGFSKLIDDVDHFAFVDNVFAA